MPDGRKDVEGMHITGASMTLEYAYQDWCLAQMAKTMGNYRIMSFYETIKELSSPLESGEWLYAASWNRWRLVALFWPVGVDGKGGFCESNSAIYSHYVPHDMTGLIELYGGADKYIERLNANLKKWTVWIFRSNKTKEGNWTDYGNQPGTGMAHLFNYAGAPWLTQNGYVRSRPLIVMWPLMEVIGMMRTRGRWER